MIIGYRLLMLWQYLTQRHRAAEVTQRVDRLGWI